jgi:hypothetical protein
MRYTFFDLFRLLVAQFSAKPAVDIDEEPTEREKLPAAAVTLEPAPKPKPDAGSDAILAADSEEPVAAPEPSGRQWHDLRGEPRTKSRGEGKGVRDWSKVTGITIHQTAVDFGSNPRRLINVPVHGATLRDGAIVLLHDPTTIMWHGHGFNKRDIGIEVSCRAAGIEGDGRTLWLPKEVKRDGVRVKSKTLTDEERLEHATEATDAQLESTRVLIRHYVELVEKHGGKIEYIHAHRQSSKSRVSDPGSRIWKACGVWAIEELGLTAGPGGWDAGGYPLPDAWTGEQNGVRYNARVPALLDNDPVIEKDEEPDDGI